MNTTRHFVQTKYGRIHYAEQGMGEPLLLLHSNGCSHHSFLESMNLLARKFRCIAWDMPAHGDSEPCTRHLSVTDYADAVVGLMDSLGIQRAHVGGTSIGGMICIALGSMHPDRLLSIVVAEAPLRTRETWIKSWPIVEAMFSIPHQEAAEIASRVRTATPALVHRWNIDRSKAGGWRMVDVMFALRDFDASAHLLRIKSPCSVIIGSQGPVATSRPDYEALLPRAHIRVLQDTGHFPMLDDPEVFATAVREGIEASTLEKGTA